MNRDAALTIEDDASEHGKVAEAVARLASDCDLVLGPYSTELMRVAGTVASEIDCLLWNHGGAGDDVQRIAPGRIVSILTPASQYARPFLLKVAAEPVAAPLMLVTGSGRFAQQVTAGAQALASQLGIATIRGEGGARPAVTDLPETWDLFCVGSFEADVEAALWARSLARPPRMICTVAAGIREFGSALSSPEGAHGIAQWFPGAATAPTLGPFEADFLDAYATVAEGSPDYVAVQAAAAAVLAINCAEVAGGTTPEALWSVASRLNALTLFGRFRIEPTTGVQIGHETVLVRWSADGPVLFRKPSDSASSSAC